MQCKIKINFQISTLASSTKQSLLETRDKVSARGELTAEPAKTDRFVSVQPTFASLSIHTFIFNLQSPESLQLRPSLFVLVLGSVGLHLVSVSSCPSHFLSFLSLARRIPHLRSLDLVFRQSYKKRSLKPYHFT
jgi:hypothetical protein